MKPTLLTLLLCGIGLPALRADVQLPSIFGDHMVLQQGAALPVWGTAAPGEKVEVSFAGKKAAATADAQGHWQTSLAAVPAASEPQDFTVAGKNRVVFTDVLVGEVWVASGQSNMVLSGRNLVTKDVAEKKQVRFFMTPVESNILPQATTTGQWHVCQVGDWPKLSYSAVGYHFAVSLQQDRGVPVGMIQSAVSGTAIERWEELSALQKSEPYRKMADGIAARRAKMPELMAKYEKETLPAWLAQHPAATPGAATAEPAAPGESTTAEEGTGTNEPADGTKPPARSAANNKPAASNRPPLGSNKPPVPPDRDGSGPTSLYNAMVNPHIPYAIKGVLWYQGEANAQNDERGKQYAELLPLLISGWRAQWKEGDFPFLFVQLPAFTVTRPWEVLRNSQFKTLSVPNTGMAVALDLNPTDNLHPPNKEEVGRRLSLLARRLAYGETLVASGPLYQAMKVEGNRVRVFFTETGSGLTPGEPPPAYRKQNEDPAAATTLAGFKVAAADGVWVPAQAVIDGKTVLVSSDAVAQPVNVSYAFEAHPTANLYNKEGLPASPFRSDDAPNFAKK